MKLTRTLVLSFSALGLAAGTAWPDDKADKDRRSGFEKLDKNHDGYVTPAEARGNARLTKDFNTFDVNNDGKLNHAEYVAAIIKQDAVNVKDKVVEKVNSGKSAAAAPAAAPAPEAGK